MTNTFMQMTRLGVGYDLSPDVNFYMEIIQSSVWGANGIPGSTGADNDALNHNGATTATNGNGGVLGVRAAYMLIRNFAGMQGFSVKAGRQYVVFGQPLPSRHTSTGPIRDFPMTVSCCSTAPRPLIATSVVPDVRG